MEPFYQDEWTTIYNADCREVLPVLNKTFSAVITSPPYNLNCRVGANRKYIRRNPKQSENSTKYGSYPDNLLPGDYKSLQDECLGWCIDNAEYVFWNVQPLSGNKTPVFQMIGEQAENLKDFVIWTKQNPCPPNNEGTLSAAMEFILIFNKDAMVRQFPKSTFARGSMHNVWSLGQSRGGGHAATFPPELVANCISLCSPETVLDPFCGTGTTLVKCKELGIKTVGIEIDPNYCQLAVDNMRQDYLF